MGSIGFRLSIGLLGGLVTRHRVPFRVKVRKFQVAQGL